MRTKVLVVVVPLAVAAGIVSHRSSHAQVSEPEPVILVAARAIAHSGAPLGGASNRHEFVPGTTTTHYLVAGSISRGDACSLGAISGDSRTLEQVLAEHAQVWTVATTPLRRDEGQLVFALEWTRHAGGNGTRPVVSGRHELALFEGQRHIVDLLHAGSDEATCPTGSIVLEVESAMRESVAAADRLIRYDMWLRHTAPDGRTQSRWIVVMARHGVDLPFGFPALRFPVPQLAADQYAFDVTARVDGYVRGRINLDGTIGVELRASRWNGLERRGTDQGGMAWVGQGRKFLRLVPGEAIEIKLPTGVGMWSLPAAPGAPGVGGSSGQIGSALGVEPFMLSGGQLSVFFEPFFQGHTVSLLLRVRPVDPY